MTKNTDFACMLHMIAPYRVGYDEVAYDVQHLRNYDVIYLHTDDSYVSACMYFDKTGKFVGFCDPDYTEIED